MVHYASAAIHTTPPTANPRTIWLGMELVMLDVVYLIGGCVFFVIAVLYTTVCDRL